MTTPVTLHGLPGVGLGLRFRYDPLRLLSEACRRGDLVALDFGVFGTFYAAFDPGDIRTAFRAGLRRHRAKLRALLGDGLFVVQSGEPWRKQRRLLQPAFHRNRLDELVGAITDRVAERYDRVWREYARSGQVFDLADEMSRLSIEIILATTFGPDLLDIALPLADELGYVVRFLDHQLFSPFSLPARLPTPANRRYRRAIARFEEALQRALERRRAPGAAASDFVSSFLQASTPEGETMSPRELRDEVISTFVAGTETMGMALTWCWRMLAATPETADRGRAEADEVLGERAPTAADLARMSYAQAIVQETLRLFPPAWAMVRVLEEPSELQGHSLQPGDTMVVSSFVTHRDPRFWDEPLAFRPERFLDGQPDKYAYFPFGQGQHQCIGNRLSVMESALAVIMGLQRFRIELVRDYRKLLPHIALTPEPTPLVRISLR